MFSVSCGTTGRLLATCGGDCPSSGGIRSSEAIAHTPHSKPPLIADPTERQVDRRAGRFAAPFANLRMAGKDDMLVGVIADEVRCKRSQHTAPHSPHSFVIRLRCRGCRRGCDCVQDTVAGLMLAGAGHRDSTGSTFMVVRAGASRKNASGSNLKSRRFVVFTSETLCTL